MDWPKAIVAIVSLLRKWGGMIAAYFMGRKAQADADRKAADAEIIKELEDENEKLAEISRRRADPSERDRVRDKYRRPPKGET